MYGSVAGAGAAAGVPTALAFSGSHGPFVAGATGVALASIAAGVVLLRASYRRR